MHKNENEFIKIYKQEKENLFRYVRLKINGISDMDAEDIVADVLFNVYNRMDAEKHIENLAPYLYQSLKNRIWDWFRKPQKLLSLDAIDDNTNLSIGEKLIDDKANIERLLEKKELALRLKNALMELEPKQRAVWVATEIEGHTFKELSLKWEEPIGTLLARKSRATKILKKMLENEKM